MLKKLFPWIILLLTMLFYAYEFFLRILPGAVVPELMGHYQFSASGISLLASSYYVAYMIGQIPSGFWLDRYPLGKVLSISTLLCALSALAFVMTTNSLVAIGSRFLLGFVSACSFIAVLQVTRHYLPPHYFTVVAGIAIAFATLTGSYAQTLAVLSSIDGEWITIFIYTALLGLILACVFGVTLRKVVFLNPPHVKEKWQDIVSLLRNKVLWLNGMMGGLFYLPTSVFATVWGIHFLETTYHLNEQQSAYAISYLFLGWVIATPILGWIAQRWQCERQLLLFGCIGLSSIIMMILFFPLTVKPFINIYFLIFGLISGVQVMVWKFYNDLLAHQFTGLGIALTNMIIMITTSIAHVLIGFVIDLDSNFSLLPNEVDARFSLVLMPFALLVAVFALRYIPQHGVNLENQCRVD